MKSDHKKSSNNPYFMKKFCHFSPSYHSGGAREAIAPQTQNAAEAPGKNGKFLKKKLSMP